MRSILRWLFRLVTIASALSLAGCAALWVASYNKEMYAVYPGDPTSTHFWGARGRLYVSRELETLQDDPDDLSRCISCSFPPVAGFCASGSLADVQAKAVYAVALPAQPEESWHGFGQARQQRGPEKWGSFLLSVDATIVTAPFWAATLALAIMPGFAGWRWFARGAAGQRDTTLAAGRVRPRMKVMLLGWSTRVSATLFILFALSWCGVAGGGYRLFIQKVPSSGTQLSDEEGMRLSHARWSVVYASDAFRFVHFLPEQSAPTDGWEGSIDRAGLYQPNSDFQQMHPPRLNLLGFKTYQFASTGGVSETDGPGSIVAMVLPCWIPLLATFVLPALWLQSAIRLRVQRSRQNSRAAAGLCCQCGYDMRATRERCPECGEVVASAETAVPSPST